MLKSHKLRPNYSFFRPNVRGLKEKLLTLRSEFHFWWKREPEVFQESGNYHNSQRITRTRRPKAHTRYEAWALTVFAILVLAVVGHLAFVVSLRCFTPLFFKMNSGGRPSAQSGATMRTGRCLSAVSGATLRTGKSPSAASGATLRTGCEIKPNSITKNWRLWQVDQGTIFKDY